MLSYLEAQEAGREACGDGEALRRVEPDGDGWVAVIATGRLKVALDVQMHDPSSLGRVRSIEVRREPLGLMRRP